MPTCAQKALAWKTYHAIEADPESWHQPMWAIQIKDQQGKTCGTAYCFAGHAVLLAEPLVKFDFGADGKQVTTGHVFLPDGRHRDIPSVAAKYLGLTERQTDRLFCANNSLENLREYITDYFGPEDEPCED